MLFPARYLFCWLTGGICLVSLVMVDPIQAQITPDDTLGAERSVVTSNVFINGLPSDRIEGGAIRGTSLFHSFLKFNVRDRQAAYFTNPAGIENILSRVTGGNPSHILGRLGVLGNANLFLINPNGIIFGSNARLDVRGSFVASTASHLNADKIQFSATNPEVPPLLTVSVPLGLQFGESAGDILVQGSALAVRPGKTLALVGGNITIEGGVLTISGATNLAASGGRIELGSVAKDSLVNLTRIDEELVLGYEGVQNFKNIDLSQAAQVAAVNSGAIEDGGDLTIKTKQLMIRDGAQVLTSTQGRGNAGNLTVHASTVKLMGISDRGAPSGLFATARRGSTGAGGNLTIETGQLIVRDGAQVAVTAFSDGKAGDLTVRALEVQLIGSAPSPSSQTGLSISGLLAGTEPGSRGNAGNLTIETSRLLIQDGAEAQASTLGDGDAGSLIVRASDSVELIGTTPNGQFPSSLRTAAGLEGVSTEGRGRGGNLRLETGQLIVRDGAAVTVSADGLGEAGQLSVTARSIELNKKGALIAETASGQGGDITLQVQDLLLLRRNSNISTTAGTAQAGGNGGNIDIDTTFIVAIPSENSNITANAFTGNGGNIQIRAQSIFGIQFREEETPLLSEITASSRYGVDGVVEINTPEVDPSSGLVNLSAELVDVSRLIASGCGAAPQQGQSEFIVTGRGGLPSSPSETLSSDTVWSDLRVPTQQVKAIPNAEEATTRPNPTAGQLVEAQGWIINNKGEVVLTANAPTLTPLIPWLRSPTCSGS